MRKVMLARGGAISEFTGLGKTHEALKNSLEKNLIRNFELGSLYEYPANSFALSRLIKRWYTGPSKVTNMSKDNDIVHITDQEQAGLVPSFGNTVVTIHDLFHLYPYTKDQILIGNNKPSLIRKRDLQKIIKGIKRAKLLICISKHTQKECEMRFPGVPTALVPHGINLNEYSIETVRPSWFNEGINLLIVGSEEPRKRVEFAVKICGGMDVTLHKIGSESSPQEKAKLLHLSEKLDCKLNWVGPLNQKEMVAALQHANALLFPSIAEGFGLPPLEAYAAGTVALVSDAPAHNEIPLEHHILPYDDIDAWRNAINNLEDETDAVRNRAKEFSLEKWSERLSHAYDSLF